MDDHAEYESDTFSLPDDEQNSEAEGDDFQDDCEEYFQRLDYSDHYCQGQQTEDVEDPLAGTSETENDDTIEWGDDTSYFENLQLSFDDEPEIHADGEEIDFFEKMFTNEMVMKIVDETNKYAIQKESKNWTPVTPEEVRVFIGILIFMGIHRLPSTDHYWSTDPALRVDIIADTMPIKRFKKIVENIHFNDNSTQVPRSDPAYDKLHKIRPIVDMLNSIISNTDIYKPSSFVSVDESMVPFNGRSAIKQYMPLKPVKRGYKVWCIADAKTGFMFKFRIYTGKSDSVEGESLGEKVVMNLTTNVRAGSLVVFDNFFSSVPLLEKLHARNLFSCGTVRSTRKYLPDIIQREPKSKKLKGSKSKQVKLKRGEYQFKTKNHVAATKWMDRKPVCMLSTAHNPKDTTTVQRKNKNGSKTAVPCPKVVAEYNANMGGVDRFDQLRERYGIGRRSTKWWHRLMYFLIDMAIVNGHIMWKNSREVRKNLDQVSFRLRLARQLINGFTSRKRRGRPANFQNKKKSIPEEVKFVNVGRHWPGKGPTSRRCKHCSTKKHEKRTRFLCTNCTVPLCIECFPDFHTKKN